MPCACKVPEVEYPATAEWGPLAWDILHAIAEKCGKIDNALLQIDEIRQVVGLIEAVQKMIPCDICRAHYQEYLANKPVKGWLKEPYSVLNNNVRVWLWTLHNDINQGNDKPIFPFDGLSVYSAVPIRQRLAQLSAPIQRAMAHNGVKLLHWLAFEKYVKILG